MEQGTTALGPGSAPSHWRDAASFTRAPNWTSGRHTIDRLAENQIVVDVRAAIATRKNLVSAIVILSNRIGGADNRVQTLIEGLADQIGPHVLVVREPILSNAMNEIMSELTSRINGPILFVGYGSQALDAIALSNQVESASALVINPMSVLSEEMAERWMDKPLDTSPGGNRTARVFTFQSITSDTNMKLVARYLDVHEYTHRGNGLYVNAQFHSFVLSHLQPSDHLSFERLLRHLVAAICNPLRSPRSLYNELLEQNLIPRSFSSLPMDLRDLWDSGKISAEVNVSTDDTMTHVSIIMSGKPRGYGALTMEVIVVRGGEQIARRELDGESCSLPGKADSVEVKFKDGFGHLLGTLSVDECVEINKSKTSIFILGSCVSRDAFDLDNSPELIDYRARTALGSAFAASTHFIDTVELELNPSAFQRRMVETDLEKQLADVLAGSAFDFLLLDLIDERLQMVRHDNSYVTYSPELQVCGFVPDPKDLVEVGSSEYFEAFGVGLAKLLTIVPADKIIVNQVYWADITLAGEPVGNADQTHKHNQILDRLYRQLRRQPGIRFIVYDRSEFVSDPQHKWGPSPFHFGPNLYAQTLRGINRVANEHNG